MNRAEIDALASAAHVLRPDWRWDSLVTFLTNHFESRDQWTVARALVWLAVEPGATPGSFDHETPRLLLEDGPWWAHTVVIDPRANQPTPIPTTGCTLHGVRELPCPTCRQDAAQAVTDPGQIAAILDSAGIKRDGGRHRTLNKPEKNSEPKREETGPRTDDELNSERARQLDAIETRIREETNQHG